MIPILVKLFFVYLVFWFGRNIYRIYRTLSSTQEKKPPPNKPAGDIVEAEFKVLDDD